MKIYDQEFMRILPEAMQKSDKVITDFAFILDGYNFLLSIGHITAKDFADNFSETSLKRTRDHLDELINKVWPKELKA